MLCGQANLSQSAPYPSTPHTRKGAGHMSFQHSGPLTGRAVVLDSLGAELLHKKKGWVGNCRDILYCNLISGHGCAVSKLYRPCTCQGGQEAVWLTSSSCRTKGCLPQQEMSLVLLLALALDPCAVPTHTTHSIAVAASTSTVTHQLSRLLDKGTCQ
jgi:hypothetical protein